MDENKRWLKAEDSSVYIGIRIDYLRRFRGSSNAPHAVLSLGRRCRVPRRALAECIPERGMARRLGGCDVRQHRFFWQQTWRKI
jgi:hypothetical protein